MMKHTPGSKAGGTNLWTEARRLNDRSALCQRGLVWCLTTWPKSALTRKSRRKPKMTTLTWACCWVSLGSARQVMLINGILASLPPQSLLPLLNSLLTSQPALKKSILPLIPRPTLDTALETLSQSAKKLRDAFPYSNMPFGPMGATGSLGFGSSFNSSRVSGLGAFGRPPQTTGGSGHTSGMRDSYILSRLRPHIDEFVSACMSYLPYFSYISAAPRLGSTSPHSTTTSHSTIIQTLHKDKSHPAETFTFLHALTTHFLSQPLLTQSSLTPLLLPRLAEEWKAWVNRVDEVVNREGGMFGSETVATWAKGLDDFASCKGPEEFRVMRDIRDLWVNKVGWLVGRMRHYAMEEL